uniref:Uncharacterized protein n=1 Tax=viral metagenome TaxID=1070528 RepID=A0A6C0AGH8_9ZZZZ
MDDNFSKNEILQTIDSVHNKISTYIEVDDKISHACFSQVVEATKKITNFDVYDIKNIGIEVLNTNENLYDYLESENSHFLVRIFLSCFRNTTMDIIPDVGGIQNINFALILNIISKFICLFQDNIKETLKDEFSVENLNENEIEILKIISNEDTFSVLRVFENEDLSFNINEECKISLTIIKVALEFSIEKVLEILNNIDKEELCTSQNKKICAFFILNINKSLLSILETLVKTDLLNVDICPFTIKILLQFLELLDFNINDGLVKTEYDFIDYPAHKTLSVFKLLKIFLLEIETFIKNENLKDINFREIFNMAYGFLFKIFNTFF